MSRAPLNILHFSTADQEGGSARSAWRIHSGLRRAGHGSRMMVKWRTATTDETVTTVAAGRGWQMADRVVGGLLHRAALPYAFLPSNIALPRHPWVGAADVIQLYNIHGGYLSYGALPRLARNRPVIWRLSDLWPMTGHCVYPGPCEKWRSGCGSCPDLATYPGLPFDTTRLLWRIKKKMVAAMPDLTIVAPSSWTEKAAKDSPILGHLPIQRIPNGLDTARYAPGDKRAARRTLGLPEDGLVLLFSAHVAWSNPRKGTHILLDALRQLGPMPGLHLAVAGRDAENWRGEIPQPVTALGFLDEDSRIIAANQSADIALLPSTVENLPNSLLEALACGLPAIAFDVGGMGDGVIDGETGLLLRDISAPALAGAIKRLVADAPLRQRMAQAARTLAQREFSEQVELARFLDLYSARADSRRSTGAA